MSNPFFTSRKAALEEEEATRGVLDNSQRYLDAIEAMPLQTPRLNNDGTVNERDLYRMQQTMIPVPGTENQFMLPERADAIAQIQQAQQMAAMAQDKFQKNNATMSDVFAEAGNLFLGPFNVLAGGSMKPFGDPSEEQLTRSQAATLAASNTARNVFMELRQARIDRSTAISGALRKPMGTVALADGTMGMMYDDQGTPDTVSMGPNSTYAAKIMTGPGGIPVAVANTQQGPVSTSTLTTEQVVGQEESAALGEVAGAEVKSDAQAVYDAPTAVQDFQIQIAEIDELIRRAPEFVGANRMNPMRFIPGDPGYDFNADLEKAKSGAFLTGFQALKGGGPITEIEGMKGETSLQQMDPGQSLPQFLENAEAYKQVLQMGLDKSIKDATRDIEQLDVFERQREIKKLRGELNMTPGGQP